MHHLPRTLRRCRVVILAIALVLMASTQSRAASFDCGAASAPRERLICGDAKLSRADEALTAAFKAALLPLSDGGKAALRKDQRGWIRFTDIVCATNRKGDGPAPRSSSTDCLKAEYRERQKELETAAVKSGRLVIRRVDLFKAAASPEPHETGAHPNFTTTQISYPQIDNPRDAGEERWNKLIAEHAGTTEYLADADAENEDYWVHYVLGSISPTMISVMLYMYDYPHGTPHGMGSEEGIAWLLREGRDLQSDDVFARGEPWKPALARLVFDKAKSEEGDDFPIKRPSKLEAAAADPGHWLITDHGLTVHFRFTELNLTGVGVGGVAVEIPWSALKPYLVTTPPFPIAF
jgi:uncharacterized protein YecT (DUF1311 family)